MERYEQIYEQKVEPLYERFNPLYERFGYLYERQGFQRLEQHAPKGFAILSAFKGDDEKANLEKHKVLREDLKNAGLGFWELDGVYQYKDGTTSNELSLFVPYRAEKYPSFNEYLEVIAGLGKKFNQESVLFKFPDSYDDVEKAGKYSLLFSDGSVKSIGENIRYNDVPEMYSKFRKGKHQGFLFFFEGFRIPSNHISAYGMKAEGYILK